MCLYVVCILCRHACVYSCLLTHQITLTHSLFTLHTLFTRSLIHFTPTHTPLAHSFTSLSRTLFTRSLIHFTHSCLFTSYTHSFTHSLTHHSLIHFTNSLSHLLIHSSLTHSLARSICLCFSMCLCDLEVIVTGIAGGFIQQMWSSKHTPPVLAVWSLSLGRPGYDHSITRLLRHGR